MAKRTGKKAGTWKPKKTDAINLAAIRWYALMIEAKAIEIYGTNQAAYPRLEEALKKAVTGVMGVEPNRPIAGDGDCPPGWVQCAGDCAPVCLAAEN